MTDYYYQLLENITTGSDSSLIFFFVIVAGLVLPLYGLILKDRKYSRAHENEKRKHDADKHDKYIERERELIHVMRENSAVIAGNTAIMESMKTILINNGADTKQAFGRVHERMDTSLADTAEIKAILQAVWPLLSAGQARPPNPDAKAKRGRVV